MFKVTVSILAILALAAPFAAAPLSLAADSIAEPARATESGGMEETDGLRQRSSEIVQRYGPGANLLDVLDPEPVSEFCMIDGFG